MHLKYSAWVIGEAVPLILQDTYYIRPCYQVKESKQLYLLQRNKHREAAKTRRQRNMAQMKEQIKTPEKEINTMEISNLSDVEFKTLVLRMLEELREDLSSIKKIQSETKDALIEIKNNIQENNSRVDKAENQINDLEHRKQKTTNQNNKKKRESKKMRIL